MFQSPALILSLLLITAYAAAFALWQAGSLRDLILFWLAAAMGFAAGQLAGGMLHIIPWMIGPLHILEATAGSILFLFLARWLRVDRKQP